MARAYFQEFPTTIFKRPSEDVFVAGKNVPYDVTVTDIFIQFKIRDIVLSDASLFYPYKWKDTDRPDIVAERYYGSSNYFWLVFFSNESFDLEYDFPLNSENFVDFVYAKYNQITGETLYGTDDVPISLMSGDVFFLEDGSPFYYEEIGPGIEAYYALPSEERNQVIYGFVNTTAHHWEIDGQYIVDLETYAIHTGEKREVTLYEYEFEANEKKRDVQLLDNDYLQRVVKEFGDNMKALRTQAVG